MNQVIAFPAVESADVANAAAPRPSAAQIVEFPPRCICPWSEDFSDYDKRHMQLYALLLDGESEGAGTDELAFFVFDLDPFTSRDWVLRVVRSHLRRAHWIVDNVTPLIGW